MSSTVVNALDILLTPALAFLALDPSLRLHVRMQAVCSSRWVLLPLKTKSETQQHGAVDSCTHKLQSDIQEPDG